MIATVKFTVDAVSIRCVSLIKVFKKSARLLAHHQRVTAMVCICVWVGFGPYHRRVRHEPKVRGVHAPPVHIRMFVAQNSLACMTRSTWHVR